MYDFDVITEALEHFGSFLTDYEKKEIASYTEIWFLGLYASKLRADENASVNFGYDDENGNYNKVRRFILYTRNTVLDRLPF